MPTEVGLRGEHIPRTVTGKWRKPRASHLSTEEPTVRKWVRKHKAGGDDGLAGMPHPGRTPFLTPEQEAEALGWLTQKPTAFGFRTDLWTAARVAQLIEEKFGVAFHPNYLREWLTKRRHTPQKPARRAKQRNPAAITRWRAGEYPAVQKKSRRTAPTSS